MMSRNVTVVTQLGLGSVKEGCTSVNKVHSYVVNLL